MVGQHRAFMIQRAMPHRQGSFHGIDHLHAAGMADEAVDLLDPVSMGSQHPVHGRTQMLARERRDSTGEDDPQPVRFNAPTHNIQRIGPGVFCGRLYMGETALPAPQDAGRSAITEQGCGYDVGLGQVLHPERQRTDLHRDQQHHRARTGLSKTAGYGQAGGTPGAAQAEDWNARCIPPEPEARHGAGLQAGCGDSRRRDGDDDIDVRSGQPGTVKRILRRSAEQIDRTAQIGLGPFRPGTGLRIPLDRHDRLAMTDTGRFKHLGHSVELREPFLKEMSSHLGDGGLGQIMGGVSGPDGQQGDGRGHQWLPPLIDLDLEIIPCGYVPKHDACGVGSNRPAGRDFITREASGLFMRIHPPRRVTRDTSMTSNAAPDRGSAITLWVGFIIMCVGMFMAILDIQVVATSLPTIQTAIGVAPDQMSWVQTAYLIAEVIAIPLTGFLTRALTMRWLFVIAISVFSLASLGCALSNDFETLIFWRVIQGFSGGTLIPGVFSAVFLLFPQNRQGIATTVAGVLAVLAPTVGPIVGGWITQTYSWHWLFLINLAPGILCAVLAVWLLPREQADAGAVRRLDFASLILMALALATLEIALKEAPQRGWASPLVIGLVALSLASGVAFVRRSLTALHPVVELKTLSNRSFAIGCVLSFVLGIGLFGSVYLMPVFLAFVRGHGPLAIGMIMLVTGLAQLATAPVAVVMERRMDARLMTAMGFALFALGLGLSAFQTTATDFDEMLWPQILRGVAIMLCLLPPTRLALGGLPAAQVPDASGLFNLMRNLGGAIGLALIDTVIYGRAPILGREIVARLQAGDVDTAQALGIPASVFASRIGQPIDAATAALLEPLVEKLALVQAINEAWAMISVLTLLALCSVPFARTRAAASQT